MTEGNAASKPQCAKLEEHGPALFALCGCDPSQGRCRLRHRSGSEPSVTVGILKVGRCRPQRAVLNPGTSRQCGLLRATCAVCCQSSQGLAGVGRRAAGEPPRRSLACSIALSAQGDAQQSSTTTCAGSYAGPSQTTSSRPRRDVAFAQQLGHASADLGPAPSRGSGPASSAARWWWAGTRWAVRSRRPTPPGTSAVEPGAKGLAGLGFIDGGSSPTPVTPAQRPSALADLGRARPAVTSGASPRPTADSSTPAGRSARIRAPTAPSARPGLSGPAGQPQGARAGHQPGQYGYALDTASPPRGCALRRRTSAGSSRVAIRAAGIRPASSLRSALRADALGMGPAESGRQGLVPPAAARLSTRERWRGQRQLRPGRARRARRYTATTCRRGFGSSPSAPHWAGSAS